MRQMSDTRYIALSWPIGLEVMHANVRSTLHDMDLVYSEFVAFQLNKRREFISRQRCLAETLLQLMETCTTARGALSYSSKAPP